MYKFVCFSFSLFLVSCAPKEQISVFDSTMIHRSTAEAEEISKEIKKNKEKISTNKEEIQNSLEKLKTNDSSQK